MKITGIFYSKFFKTKKQNRKVEPVYKTNKVTLKKENIEPKNKLNIKI